MTSYSPIGNAEVDTESPVTESLMVRMRDNPLAIQEGDPTAPKIQTPALADKMVTAAKIADATITTAQVALLTLTGGPAGNLALDAVTKENMAPESSDFVIDADGGYTRIANGLLLQWKQIPTLGNDQSTTLDWKIPFTTTVAFVLASTSIPNSGTEATNMLQVVGTYTLTQVEVKNQDQHGSGINVGGWVFAIGI